MPGGFAYAALGGEGEPGSGETWVVSWGVLGVAGRTGNLRITSSDDSLTLVNPYTEIVEYFDLKTTFGTGDPEAVAQTASVGSAADSSRSDHAHAGVSSFNTRTGAIVLACDATLNLTEDPTRTFTLGVANPFPGAGTAEVNDILVVTSTGPTVLTYTSGTEWLDAIIGTGTGSLMVRGDVAWEEFPIGDAGSALRVAEGGTDIEWGTGGVTAITHLGESATGNVTLTSDDGSVSIALTPGADGVVDLTANPAGVTTFNTRDGDITFAAGDNCTLTEDPLRTFTLDVDVGAGGCTSIVDGDGDEATGAVLVQSGDASITIDVTDGDGGPLDIRVANEGVTGFNTRTGEITVAAGTNCELVEDPNGTFTLNADDQGLSPVGDPELNDIISVTTADPLQLSYVGISDYLDAAIGTGVASLISRTDAGWAEFTVGEVGQVLAVGPDSATLVWAAAITPDGQGDGVAIWNDTDKTWATLFSDESGKVFRVNEAGTEFEFHAQFLPYRYENDDGTDAIEVWVRGDGGTENSPDTAKIRWKDPGGTLWTVSMAKA